MAFDAPARVRFQRLFESYDERVFLYFRRRTDLESAQEGAADTFLVAWRRIDEIPVDRELPWLYGVARRVLSQQRRAQRRRWRLQRKLTSLAPSETPGPETVVVRNTEYAEVLHAVNRLRPRDQELLRLATWDELPHADIATILGCSAHAVDQRLYRATKRLARELRTSGHKPHRQARAVPAPGEEAP